MARDGRLDTHGVGVLIRVRRRVSRIGGTVIRDA